MDGERVAPPPLGDLGRVADLVALAVRREAVRPQDEERRPAGLAHRPDDALGDGVDLGDVRRVELLAGDPEGRRARGSTRQRRAASASTAQ
ncbi:MAG: hypothetical protein R3C15_03310 [Thermoleophilia bacterium]